MSFLLKQSQVYFQKMFKFFNTPTSTKGLTFTKRYRHEAFVIFD